MFFSPGHHTLLSDKRQLPDLLAYQLGCPNRFDYSFFINAMAKLLFILFLLIPLGEIYVLLEVGSLIGVLPTVGAIVLTAATGASLIRIQGLSTLARVRQALEQGQLPAIELVEAACLLVAGALLLTPGFITDSIGFILLVPPLRKTMILAALDRGILHAKASSGHGPGPARQGSNQGRVIEGEYTQDDS